MEDLKDQRHESQGRQVLEGDGGVVSSTGLGVQVFSLMLLLRQLE